VLAEYNGAGALQRYYVYGNYIDEPLVMHRESDSEDYYYAHDHLYSVVALIDDGGNVVERYEYDAYGKVQILSTNYEPRTTSLYANPYAFTGRRLDVLDNGNLLIYHYRHRTYDTCTARFLQQDPLEYVDGLNLYEYANSDPLIYVDPYGREAVTICVGGAFGVGLTACLAMPDCRDAVRAVAVETCVVIGDEIRDTGRSIARAARRAWDWIKNKCRRRKPPKRCLPCVPPLWTLAHRIDIVPPKLPHWPHVGSHVHYYTMHQSPPFAGCKCFWVPSGTQDGIIALGIPIVPASGGGVAP